MSNGYEIDGRTRQKHRTRAALVAAARELMDQGGVPTIDDAAARAGISRATAFRYFSRQRELLLAAHPEFTVPSLLRDDTVRDPVARLDAVVVELTRLTLAAEPQLRAMLRLSLAADGTNDDELALRRGRAVGWLEDALFPLSATLGSAAAHRLAVAIRSAVGIESLVWLTDVAGLSRDEAVALQRWSARALLQRALEGDPPPPSRQGPRAKRRVGSRAPGA